MFNITVHYDEVYERYGITTVRSDGVLETVTADDAETMLGFIGTIIQRNLAKHPAPRVRRRIGFTPGPLVGRPPVGDKE